MLEVSKIILLISITASDSGVVGLVQASLKLLLLPSPARSPRMTNQRIQRRLKAKQNLHLLLRPRTAMWSQNRKRRRRHQNQQPRGNQSVQASRRQVSPSPVRRGSDESGCRQRDYVIYSGKLSATVAVVLVVAVGVGWWDLTSFWH